MSQKSTSQNVMPACHSERCHSERSAASRDLGKESSLYRLLSRSRDAIQPPPAEQPQRASQSPFSQIPRDRNWPVGVLLALLLTITSPASSSPLPLPLKLPSALPHDYHVAITQIDHNPVTHSLEITVKIFSDDLERTVRNLGGTDLRLGDSREAPDADQIIFAYLQNRLEININGQKAALQWVGKEVDSEAVWCFCEITGVQKLSTLGITNRILTELFEDQANPVHIKANGETKSLYLSKTTLSGQVLY